MEILSTTISLYKRNNNKNNKNLISPKSKYRKCRKNYMNMTVVNNHRTYLKTKTP